MNSLNCFSGLGTVSDSMYLFGKNARGRALRLISQGENGGDNQFGTESRVPDHLSRKRAGGT